MLHRNCICTSNLLAGLNCFCLEAGGQWVENTSEREAGWIKHACLVYKKNKLSRVVDCAKLRTVVPTRLPLYLLCRKPGKQSGDIPGTLEGIYRHEKGQISAINSKQQPNSTDASTAAPKPLPLYPLWHVPVNEELGKIYHFLECKKSSLQSFPFPNRTPKKKKKKGK